MQRNTLLRYGLLIGLPVAALLLLFLAFRSWYDERLTARPLYAEASELAGVPGINLEAGELTDPDLPIRLAALARDGVRWVRFVIAWDQVEPMPGNFDWSAPDRLFALLRSHPDLKPLLVLNGSPAWARRPGNADNPLAPPQERKDFGAFAAAVARRYGSIADAYQIWHEPNIAPHWGQGPVAPEDYLGLLREAALQIRAADPGAQIILAALAPNTEPGGVNMSDIAFLDALYRAGGRPWFDAVAAQPYGFSAPPDAPASSGVLNFGRAQLLREVMVRHGDGRKRIWATAFGWNALPDGWAGRPSPWDQVSAVQQAAYARQAVELAATRWPWLGPLFWAAACPPRPADDPWRGFALCAADGSWRPVRSALSEAANRPPALPSGDHAVSHPAVHYGPGWRVVDAAADPGADGDVLSYEFYGTETALRVEGGPFWAFLRVWIDGQPANALPTDETGAAYLVLYDPLAEERTVTLARGLAPGRHQAIIEAHGGWGQWPLRGIQVREATATRVPLDGRALLVIVLLLVGVWFAILRPPSLLRRDAHVAVGVMGDENLTPHPLLLAGEGADAAPPSLEGKGAGGLGAIFRTDVTCGARRTRADENLTPGPSPARRGADVAPPSLVGKGVGGLGAIFRTDAHIAAGATADENVRSISGQRSAVIIFRTDAWPNVAWYVAAGLLFLICVFSRWLLLDLAALGGLGLLFLVRPDVALPLIAAAIPLWPRPKVLAGLEFSLCELLIWAATAAMALRWLVGRFTSVTSRWPLVNLRLRKSDPALDAPVLALLVVGLAAALNAERMGVALREFRTVFLLAGLFYLLITRTPWPAGRRFSPRPLLIGLLAGMTFVSLVALGQFITGQGRIDVEGVGRVRAFYGSPNNLALVLDRAVPLALALAAFGAWRGRGTAAASGTSGKVKTVWVLGLPWPRLGYGLAFAIMLLACVVTYSKGALLLGLPAGLAVVLIGGAWRSGRRWPLWALAGLAVIGAVGLIVLSRTPRFAGLTDLDTGTGFFRLKLWQSAWRMWLDHPWLGVGPDNFLYAYRTCYVLPTAWQELNLSHPHNIVLDFGTRLGIVGTAVGAWLLVVAFRRGWQRFRAGDDHAWPVALGLLAGLTATVAHGLLDNSLFLMDLMALFMLSVGVWATDENG